MRINLIYARAANGVIGKDNAMPWHLPEDLAHFRQHTRGCPVIMGRATWYSLPERFRPLPGRVNVVLTRDAATARQLTHEGATVQHSLDEALAYCSRLEPAPADVWIMGGAQIYAQALPLAHRAVVTEIEADFEGDAYAPTLGPEWQETVRQRCHAANGLRLAFVTYVKNVTAPV